MHITNVNYSTKTYFFLKSISVLEQKAKGYLIGSLLNNIEILIKLF